jgi:hypothetical protein
MKSVPSQCRQLGPVALGNQGSTPVMGWYMGSISGGMKLSRAMRREYGQQDETDAADEVLPVQDPIFPKRASQWLADRVLSRGRFGLGVGFADDVRFLWHDRPLPLRLGGDQ